MVSWGGGGGVGGGGFDERRISCRQQSIKMGTIENGLSINCQ